MPRQPLEHDRSAFLAQVSHYSSPSDVADITEALDRLIEWSEARPSLLRHFPNSGEQRVVRFGVAGSGQVFWAAYPRQIDGAKAILFPKASREVPESLRVSVRNRLSEAFGIEWPTRYAVPTVPLRVLGDTTAWTTFRATMELALEKI